MNPKRKTLSSAAPVADPLRSVDPKGTSTEAIHRAFHDALMGFLVKKVKDRDLADDLFQETLLKVHTSLPSLKDSSKLSSWIFQIARNVITDHHRKKKPIYDSEVLDLKKFEDITNSEGCPSYMAMSGCVEGMVENLPEKYREAIKQYDLSEGNQEAVAQHLGISVAALKSRLSRGRQALKQEMAGCCRSQVSKQCQSKTTSTLCGCQDYNEVS